MHTFDKYISSYMGKALLLSAFILPSVFLQARDSVVNSTGVRKDTVVTVGMSFQQSEKSIAGAVSTIYSDEFVEVPVATTSNAITGKVPGLLSRQSSGEPGNDAALLYIRGLGTFGNITPLVIIDGFPRDKADLDILDPNEISSITVLKDVSSTALYGIQGANGAIIITTKRGYDPGRLAPRISFSTHQTILQAQRLPQTMGAYDQAMYFKTLDANDGKPERYDDQTIQTLVNGSDPVLYPHTNWFDVALKDKAYQQQYNVNISGQAGKSHIVKYFVSGSYINQQTLMNNQAEFKENYKVNPKYDRFNFRSNVDFKATRHFSIRADFSAVLENQVSPYSGFSSILSGVTAQSPNSSAIFNPNGTIAASSALEDYVSPGNPYGLLTRSAYYTKGKDQMTGSIAGKFDIDEWVKGLSVEFTYNFKVAQTLGRNWSQGFDSYSYLGKVGGEDVYEQASESTKISCGSSATVNKYQYYDLRINYARSFGKHDVGAYLVGHRTQNDLQSSQYTYGYQGLSFRATYGYSNRYFAEFNLGYNGSDNFHPDRRYGVFPAGSVAWLLSEEEWFKVDWLKYAKLRASYGIAGNDLLGDSRFLYVTEYSRGGTGIFPYGYYFGTTTSGYDSSASKGYNESKVGNTFVTWETASKLNVGLDLDFFKDGSLSLKADYFREDRDNILLNATKVTGIVGISNIPAINAGRVLNQGVDFQLAFNKQFNKDFRFFASLLGTYAKNKVIENGYPETKYAYQNLRGLDVGYSLGYQAIGYFQDAHDIANSPKQSWGDVIPGDIKYQDTNNDNVINEDDRVPIKCTAYPDLTGSLSLGFAWRGLDFSMQFDGAMGGTAYLYPYSSSVINLERWSESNKSGARLPVAHTSTNNSLYNSSFIMKTDYLKLRNIEIGYSLPTKALNTIKLHYLRVFFNVRNVFTIDSMWLQDRDPETAGGTALPYPIQRGYNFGIRFEI